MEQTRMTFTLGLAAELTQGVVLSGFAGQPITDLASLEDAGPGDLSFFDGERYRKAALASRAGAMLVRKPLAGWSGSQIQVAAPYESFLQVANALYPPECPPVGVHTTALVSSEASIATDASIGPHVIVEAGASIGTRSVISSNTFIGRGASIGPDCVLYPNVVVWHRTRLGARVIVHAGAVIGDDGFGYRRDATGHRKIPHVGNVEVGDDVEIGSNTTIDRGTFGATRIGAGSKIDNLVQIGHNVQIGERVLVVAQAGLAGSSQVGDDAILAGQVGVGDHAVIGPGAVLVAKSGVDKRAKGGEAHGGTPIMPYKQWMQVSAALRYLPGLLARVRGLERRLRLDPTTDE